MRDITSLPAPNVYKIPTILGSSKEGGIRSAPAFTITGRQKSKINPNVFIPGPGAYESNVDPLQKKSPVYSMSARYGIPTDNHSKPGPGAHYPEKVRILTILSPSVF